MQFDFLKDNIIVVCSNNIKLQIIEYCISNKQLFNIKYMTLNKMINALTFDYDEKTIVEVMNKFNVSYKNSKIYLSNIKYIDDNLNDDRINLLAKIKKYCMDFGLFKSNQLLTNAIRKKEVFILEDLNDFEKMILDKNNIKYKYINLNCGNFIHKHVYEFKTLDDEIHFVANKICELISEGIDINKISLLNVDANSDYMIRRIFKMYNLPYNRQFNTSIYETAVGKYFLENINKDINETIKLTLNKYNDSKEIINSIVDIINRYFFIDDFRNYKEILIEEFKLCFVKSIKVKNAVRVKDLNDFFNDDEYVFLIGFNLGVIPKTYKDEDYISDNIKPNYLESTVKKNILEKEKVKNFVLNIKNLTISYKLNYLNENFYPSNLIEELNLEIINEVDIITNYSEIANKLLLVKDLDLYMQFGEKTNNLSTLLFNYPEVNYNTYSSKFNGIKDFKKNIVLSYSSMNNYYKCAFRYYLANILKIDIFNENFSQYVGNLFHHVLEVCLNNENEEIDCVYDDYIKNNNFEFSEKNKFFLKTLKDEIKFIITTIKEQYSYSDYNACYFEKEIEIDEDDVKFKGFIDKLLIKDDKMVIIDYKTGSIDINLNLVNYGLSLQLPVYLYLARKLNKNAKIVGFYLQHILNTPIRRNNKKNLTTLKKDALKLQGYSLGNEEYLSEFDSTYKDSKVIKSMKLGNNGFYHYSKVLTEKEIDNLVDLVDKKIKDATRNIKNGEFTINPKVVGKVNEGCAFCKFKDICFLNENDKVYLNDCDDLGFLGGDDNA